MTQPTVCDTDEAQLAFLAWGTPELPEETPAHAYLVNLWHGDECGICGAKGYVLVDHDHETHLTRGMLCRSCNAREGRGHGGVYAEWRDGQNPGQMYGLAEEYWTAFSWQEHLPKPSSDTMRRGAEAAGRIG